ncbi:glycerol uptake transporter [Ameyamaea chiangmaiensis NBRC 103196]|uniref:Aquaporin family protein n=1 Tax=Ameyamaea chiangmaiensis TaxID=442969 RepID=A0A850P8R2_9PROT|nr:MIP/aquaporin family protein [Ameyamaea chiangmaiensis]MBS4073653.1 aquaporin family protein [Ameyamaea chiangmaiensis]NVN39079.1 aquaporin family protein [Ameyamaea chiangmaiensis]GBQ68926.1 glycerol uptake transporter [Ameyamaea chiangmaiensis NBRC 103196]
MKIDKKLLGELIAEMVAVFIIILFGDSVAAMYTLYDPSPYKTAYWGVCIVWGLGVTIAIYVTGAVSGTHANPAVTIALATFRGFSWKKTPLYIVAQVLGGFLGAAAVYALFSPVIDHFNEVHHFTRALDGGAAGVFFTHPGEAVTPMHSLLVQTILTGMLVFGIFAITCEYNTMAPQANSGALIIGLLVATIGASAGYLDAWAINPARDFGPRLFCYFAGWGPQALPAPQNYWWVPVLGPTLGGLVGGGAYYVLIRPFMPERLVEPMAPTPVVLTETALPAERFGAHSHS